METPVSSRTWWTDEAEKKGQALAMYVAVAECAPDFQEDYTAEQYEEFAALEHYWHVIQSLGFEDAWKTVDVLVLYRVVWARVAFGRHVGTIRVVPHSRRFRIFTWDDDDLALIQRACKGLLRNCGISGSLRHRLNTDLLPSVNVDLQLSLRCLENILKCLGDPCNLFDTLVHILWAHEKNGSVGSCLGIVQGWFASNALGVCLPSTKRSVVCTRLSRLCAEKQKQDLLGYPYSCPLAFACALLYAGKDPDVLAVPCTYIALHESPVHLLLCASTVANMLAHGRKPVRAASPCCGGSLEKSAADFVIQVFHLVADVTISGVDIILTAVIDTGFARAFASCVACEPIVREAIKDKVRSGVVGTFLIQVLKGMVAECPDFSKTLALFPFASLSSLQQTLRDQQAIWMKWSLLRRCWMAAVIRISTTRRN